MTSLFARENQLLVLLAFAEATLLLDRLAVGFLAPFVIPDMGLSNLQLGLLSSLFSGSFALSGYVVSSLSDRGGNRWAWIASLIVLFSIASAACGLSHGFVSLAALRIVLGLLEGPFLPIALSVMAQASSPGRRSFNLAFVQNVGAFLLAQLAGPVVLVWVAVRHGWRAAFIFTAMPGAVIALLMLMMLGSMRSFSAAVAREQEVTAGSLRHANLWLCVAIAACMGSWILLQMTFLPKYLVQVARMTPTHMSFVLSLLGISGCLSSILLPALSDRFGRRPIIMLGIALASLSPLAALLVADRPGLLTLGVLAGSLAFGCSPLYVSIIPADCVPADALARAMAIVSASSAICGGIVAPAIAGGLADRMGLGVVLWLAAGLSLVALALAAFLKPDAQEGNKMAPDGLAGHATAH